VENKWESMMSSMVSENFSFQIKKGNSESDGQQNSW